MAANTTTDASGIEFEAGQVWNDDGVRIEILAVEGDRLHALDCGAETTIDAELFRENIVEYDIERVDGDDAGGMLMRGICGDAPDLTRSDWADERLADVLWRILASAVRWGIKGEVPAVTDRMEDLAAREEVEFGYIRVDFWYQQRSEDWGRWVGDSNYEIVLLEDYSDKAFKIHAVDQSGGWGFPQNFFLPKSVADVWVVDGDVTEADCSHQFDPNYGEEWNLDDSEDSEDSDDDSNDGTGGGARTDDGADSEDSDDETPDVETDGGVDVDSTDEADSTGGSTLGLKRVGYTLSRTASCSSTVRMAIESDYEHTERGTDIKVEYRTAASGYEDVREVTGRIVDCYSHQIVIVRDSDRKEMRLRKRLGRAKIDYHAFTVETNGTTVGAIQQDAVDHGISFLCDDYSLVPVETDEAEDETPAVRTDGGEDSDDSAGVELSEVDPDGDYAVRARGTTDGEAYDVLCRRFDDRAAAEAHAAGFNGEGRERIEWYVEDCTAAAGGSTIEFVDGEHGLDGVRELAEAFDGAAVTLTYDSVYGGRVAFEGELSPSGTYGATITQYDDHRTIGALGVKKDLGDSERHLGNDWTLVAHDVHTHDDSADDLVTDGGEETRTFKLEVTADQASELYMALTTRQNRLTELGYDYSSTLVTDMRDAKRQLYAIEADLRGWDGDGTDETPAVRTDGGRSIEGGFEAGQVYTDGEETVEITRLGEYNRVYYGIFDDGGEDLIEFCSREDALRSQLDEDGYERVETDGGHDAEPRIVIENPADHTEAAEQILAADGKATDQWRIELNDGTVYDDPYSFRVAYDNSAGVRDSFNGEGVSFYVDDIKRIEWYGPADSAASE